MAYASENQCFGNDEISEKNRTAEIGLITPQPRIGVTDEETICPWWRHQMEALRRWPLWGEFTGHR